MNATVVVSIVKVWTRPNREESELNAGPFSLFLIMILSQLGNMLPKKDPFRASNAPQVKRFILRERVVVQTVKLGLRRALKAW